MASDLRSQSPLFTYFLFPAMTPHLSPGISRFQGAQRVLRGEALFTSEQTQPTDEKPVGQTLLLKGMLSKGVLETQASATFLSPKCRKNS